MKKVFFICLLIINFGIYTFGQEVLPNYNGFWSKYDDPYDDAYEPWPKITHFFEHYPDRLDILRNEIYARYGRPFVNEKYRQYFFAQSWYKERHNFSENWLKRIDKDAIKLIRSIENIPPCYGAIDEAKKKNIVYTGVYDIHFSKFTSTRTWIGTNSSYTDDYIQVYEEWNWIVIGNWIIVYNQIPGQYERGRYQANSFLIDPNTRTVLDFEYSQIEKNIFESFLYEQEAIKLQYTNNW
jgi:hypothetical protein